MIIKSDEKIIYDKREFKKCNRHIYHKKNNIKREIYKCIYNRKYENKLIKNKSHKSFCNATLEYIYPHQNIKSGFFL